MVPVKMPQLVAASISETFGLVGHFESPSHRVLPLALVMASSVNQNPLEVLSKQTDCPRPQVPDVVGL